MSFCITNFGSLLVGGRDQRDPDFTAYLALLKSLSKDNPRPSLEHTDFVNLQPGSFLLSCAADINYVVGDPNGRTLQPGNLVIISDSIQKRGWTSTTSEPIVVEIPQHTQRCTPTCSSPSRGQLFISPSRSNHSRNEKDWE